RDGREPRAHLRPLSAQGRRPGGRRCGSDDLGPGAVLDHPAESAPRHRGLHAVRRLGGKGQAVDDAPARPGRPEPGRARAEAGLWPVPPAHEPAASIGRSGPLMMYLDGLAAFVHGVRLDALPGSTIAASKLVLLDTIGAIVAGSALPENARLARIAAQRAPHGLCTLVGHAMKADSLL